MNDDRLTYNEFIIERLKELGVPFKANDNISGLLNDADRKRIEDDVALAFEGVLKALCIDVENDHNTKDTARRVAKMYVHEVFAGRFYPAPNLTSFPNSGYDGIYVTGPITVRSTCAHHFQNITGKCWVGVMVPPGMPVPGLSKYSRIVDHICARPTIQEEMAVQIADAIGELLETEDVAVLIDAEHHCMTHRGVREHETSFKTPIMRGIFTESDALRAEFYNLVSMKAR